MIAIQRRAVVDEYRQFSFQRGSVAFDSRGRLYYPHQARFETVNGRTGVRVEEGTSNLLSTTNSQGFTSPVNITVTNGTTYTVSMTGTGSITLSDAGTGTVTASSPVTFTADGTTLTLTPNGDTGRVQVEAKPYKTSWQIGGTTRAAETLTVPTAGVLSGLPSWTIEGWLLFNSLSYNQFGGLGHNVFWHMGNGGDGFGEEYEIHLARLYNDRKLSFYAPSVGQRDSSFIINDGQWYYIAFVYDNGVYRLYANGQKLIEVTGSTIDYAQLGSVLRLNHPYGGGRYVNGLLGPHRISRRARTDQEIADAYAAGTLTADEDTTLLLPFTGPDAQRGARTLYIPAVGF